MGIKIHEINMKELALDRESFHHGFELYWAIFGKGKLPESPDDIAPEKMDEMFKFITGFKIGLEIGTKLGEDNGK